MNPSGISLYHITPCHLLLGVIYKSLEKAGWQTAFSLIVKVLQEKKEREMQKMKHICKDHQTGYCKHKKQCNRKHINEICSRIKDCNEINCIKRHPKTCKYFTIYKYCKFDNCAYLHEHSGSNPTMKLLEKNIPELQSEID